MTLTKQQQRDKEWRVITTKIDRALKVRDAIVKSAWESYEEIINPLWESYQAKIKEIDEQVENKKEITKVDLLRDCLTDLLINFEFNFDPSDDGDNDENSIEIVRNEVIDDMMSTLEDYDKKADKSDFEISVVINKKGEL